MFGPSYLEDISNLVHPSACTIQLKVENVNLKPHRLVELCSAKRFKSLVD